MAYSDLKTDIADWLDRDDLTSRIDTFIDHAEARFNRVIRHWRMIASDELDLSSGRTVAQPSDFIEARRLWVTNQGELHYIAPAPFYQRYPTSVGEIPKHFTIEGSNFIFSGTGDDVQLSYYQQITALSDSNTTNWLLTYHPDIYLAGSLIAARGFIGDEARLEVWIQLLAEGLKELKRETRDHDFNSASMIMGGSRP